MAQDESMVLPSEDEVDSEDHGNSESVSMTNPRGDILPRDRQHKTPTYDYAYEKSMSQAEAKLFYHHHQLASRGAESECLQPSGSYSSNQHDADIQTQANITADTGKPEQTPLNAVSDSSGFQAAPSARAFVPTSQITTPTIKPEETVTVVNQWAQSHSVQPGIHFDQGPHPKASPNPQAFAPGAAHETATLGSGSDAVMSELNVIYSKIRGLLDKRSKYIRLSFQGKEDNPRDHPEWKVYPPPPEPAWEDYKDTGRTSSSSHGGQRRRKMGQDIGEDFDMAEFLPLPGESPDVFRLDENSIYQIYPNGHAADLREPVVQIPSLRDFYMDLDAIFDISSDGPAKSFAFKRLSYLEGKFQLHALLNEYQEMADSKKVPHRDFYNVRKVDTHVHHSACMNQKHLLRFIKSKMKKSPDEVVLFRDGKHLTLREVFESIKLTAYDLSIDTLDMHVCLASLTLPKKKLSAKAFTRHTQILFTGLINSISSTILLGSHDYVKFFSRQTIISKAAIWLR